MKNWRPFCSKQLQSQITHQNVQKQMLLYFIAIYYEIKQSTVKLGNKEHFGCPKIVP